jgi:transcription antitermination factor NusG
MYILVLKNTRFSIPLNGTREAVACPKKFDLILMSAKSREKNIDPWYALWVRSRHEKTVAEVLTDKGFETFLPVYRSRRRWSDRIQEVELPLIPSYVFCRFEVSHRLPILTTPGVVHIVGTGKTPQAVDEIEMQSLITAVRAGVHLQLWPYLKLGQRVSIEEGPLRSLEGVLVTTKGTDQLILSVSLLQRSVAIAVDRRWIRPIGNDAHLAAGSADFNSGVNSASRRV